MLLSPRNAILLAIAVGVFLRLAQYAANRALWLDEALLASNIVGRSFREVLGPLDYAQTAPAGFLLLERTAIAVLGPGEYALRLLPLMAGVTSVFLFAVLARRLLSPGAAPVAVALFALSPFLVYYSAEVKQYSFDVLVVLLLLWTGASALNDGLSRRNMAVLLGLGVLGVWFSQPAVFVLAGLGITLGFAAVRRGEWNGILGLTGVGAAWMLSFAGSYTMSRQGLPDTEYMRAFWRDGFMPLPPQSLADLLWFPAKVLQVFRDPIGVTDDAHREFALLHPIVGIAAFTLGSAWLLQNRSRTLALLGLPILFTLLASGVQAYPFGGYFSMSGRVILFLLPCFFLIMAEGVEWLRSGMGRQASAASRGLGLALVAVLVFPFAAYAVRGVPQLREETPPLLEHARENWAPGDYLYVYYNARPAFDYYRDRYGFLGKDFTIGSCSRLAPLRYLDDLSRLQGRSRVWILFVGGKAAFGFDEKSLMLDFLDHVGRRLDDRVSVGASLYLYDLSRPFSEAGTYSALVPDLPNELAFDCRGPWGPAVQRD